MNRQSCNDEIHDILSLSVYYYRLHYGLYKSTSGTVKNSPSPPSITMVRKGLFGPIQLFRVYVHAQAGYYKKRCKFHPLQDGSYSVFVFSELSITSAKKRFVYPQLQKIMGYPKGESGLSNRESSSIRGSTRNQNRSLFCTHFPERKFQLAIFVCFSYSSTTASHFDRYSRNGSEYLVS